MLSFQVLAPGEINVANNVILDKEFSFGTCLWLLLCKNNKAIISFLHVCESIKLPLFPKKKRVNGLIGGENYLKIYIIHNPLHISGSLQQWWQTCLVNMFCIISSVPTTCSWALALQTSRKQNCFGLHQVHTHFGFFQLHHYCQF